MPAGSSGRGRTKLSPAERKHRAMKGAAARWGHPAPAAAPNGPLADVEPREAILRAAIEAFTHQDMALVTVQGVADLAGVGLPTLYRHFPNKEALVNACRLLLVERGLRRLDRLLAANASPAAKICALALGLCYGGVNPTESRQTFKGLVDPRSGTIDATLGPVLNTYWQAYFEAGRALGFDQAEARILNLQASIIGLSRFRPVRESVPELETISRSYEELALFVLSVNFPGVDWRGVRSETVFPAPPRSP